MPQSFLTSRVARVRAVTLTLTLASFGLTTVVSADCPSSGEAQLNWKNGPIPLPGSSAEFLVVVEDSCRQAAPPATVVTAKLTLENQSDATQTVECWLATTKSSDYGRVTVPARGFVGVTLQIANVSGGDANANQAHVSCRNAEEGNANDVNATWLKIVTKVVEKVSVFPTP